MRFKLISIFYLKLISLRQKIKAWLTVFRLVDFNLLFEANFFATGMWLINIRKDINISIFYLKLISLRLFYERLLLKNPFHFNLLFEANFFATKCGAKLESDDDYFTFQSSI